MPPRNPSEQLLSLPVDGLVLELLKQFQRLLADRDVPLTVTEMKEISERAANYEPLPEKVAAIQAAMVKIVQESQNVLTERFGFTFPQSLATDMSTIGGWETTAEFLEIANHKSNAELRISAGSSLLALLGDDRYTEPLFAVVAADDGEGDVDATIARRALTHYARVEPTAPDWVEQVRAKLASTG